MSDEQPIRHIDLIPTPEAMQRMVAVLRQQIKDSRRKISNVQDLQEALENNGFDSLCYRDSTQEENTLLTEALGIGFEHILAQEEERIRKIEEGLTNE